MEIERSARIGSILAHIGISNNTQILCDLAKQVVLHQNDDGGWRNVEESIWCIEVLKQLGFSEVVNKAYNWLISQRITGGGWGQNSRDFARIPLTSLLLLFHSNIVEKRDVNWLIDAVKEEVLDSPDVFLTYKISLPIIGLRRIGIEIPRKEALLELLISQQNVDGGFGPWKNHPIKSDIISSAYAVIALVGEKRYEPELYNCLIWIIHAQLENGSWPYHYIDHGACMGALSLYKTLNSISHH